LELQQLLIREPPAPARTANTLAIFDALSNEQVGSAREEFASRWRSLHFFLNWTFLPTKLEVCETEDESLVFTVLWMAGWWRRRLEVYDADESLIGYGEQRALSGPRSFWVYDRRGLPFVEVQEALRGHNCCFMGQGGRELGAVTSAFSDVDTARHYVVSIAEEVADQPFAKMLLLAAALAIYIVPQMRAK
jgi:hypothetical protein